jgi:uncharacterized protein YjbI with pentapeptide repeats
MFRAVEHAYGEVSAAEMQRFGVSSTLRANQAWLARKAERILILAPKNAGGAFLVGASLRGADLRGAYLRLAKLDGADLSDANLGGGRPDAGSLNRAHCDSGTKLPAGLTGVEDATR